MGLSALQPVESTRAPYQLAIQVPIYSFPVHSNPLLVAPHLIITTSLKLPNQKLINAHTLINSGSQSSLINNSFVHHHLLPQIPLHHPIPIHGLDNNPLSDGLISHTIPVDISIENHSEHKHFGVVSMNYDIILGIDWLQKHNPSINWKSNQITFLCCNTIPVGPWLGDMHELPLLCMISHEKTPHHHSHSQQRLEMPLNTKIHFPFCTHPYP